MTQLSLFGEEFDAPKPKKKAPKKSEFNYEESSIEPEEPFMELLKAGKPHPTISIQPNGYILYQVKGLGWFTDWRIAVEGGHQKVEGLEFLYKENPKIPQHNQIDNLNPNASR